MRGTLPASAAQTWEGRGPWPSLRRCAPSPSTALGAAFEPDAPPPSPCPQLEVLERLANVLVGQQVLPVGVGDTIAQQAQRALGG